MSPHDDRSKASDHDDFVRAGQRKRASLVGEMVHMVRTTRKWWMMPLIAILVILGVVLLITSTGAGPLIYTLF
jgi:hypothetical protein